MVDLGFSRQLTLSGFRHRATPVPGGRISYRLADGSGHVSLDAREWEALVDDFSDESRRIVRKAKWAALGLLPGIFLFGMTLAQILPGGGLVILLAFFLGPVAIYLWQSYRVKWAAQAVERALAGRDRVAAPRRRARRFRPPRWLEIAFLLLVGPHLVAQVYGTIDPDAFRNTPWTGTRLDAWGIAGFAVLAAILFLRWRSRGAGADSPRDRRQAEDEDESGRARDVLARARTGSAGAVPLD